MECLQPDKTPLFLRDEDGDYIVCEGPRTGARYRSDAFRFLGRFEDGLITVVVSKSWLMKVERGYGRVDSISVRPGDILLLPENYGTVTLSGDMTVSVEERL